jgi:hypothetical protein
MQVRRLQVLLSAAVTVIALAQPAAAATCAVPAGYATIAAALADPGCATIQVAAGTYYENLVVSHSLTLEGAGQGATIIDGGAAGRVIDVGPGLTVQIRDLTVTNGKLQWDNGAGIRNGSVVSPQPGQGSHLTLTRVRVANNDAGDGYGGGILNNRYSTLLVEHSTISANTARDGGGLGVVIDSVATVNDSVVGGPTRADGNIAGNSNSRGFGGGINNTDGTVYINRSVIRHNWTRGMYGPGPGGGICNDTTNGHSVLHIADSTISDNFASVGGAVAGDGFRGTITVTGSTLSGNTIEGYYAHGGAIWLYNGHALTMTNSTLSGNVAKGVAAAVGGAIGTIALYNATYDSSVNLTNVTIADNLAWATGNDFVAPSNGGGGIGRQSGVRFRIHNTIVSGNMARLGEDAPFRSDCGGAELQSLGHNLFGQDGQASGCPANGTTDVVPAGGVFTSDVIGPLAGNGGLTLTHLPVSGGPAVDAGDSTVSLTTDQIGGARLFGAAVDIGAVELVSNTPPSADAGGPYSVLEGGSVALSGTGADAEQDASTLSYAWDLDHDGTFETPGAAVVFSAAALDGPSSVTVGFQVCDAEGACDVETATIAVANVAPTLSLSGASSLPAGGTFTLEGQYVDPGVLDTHTVTIAWGDGASETLAVTGGAFSVSRQYLAAGTYTLSARVTDDDGGEGCDELTLTVTGASGKVTGGGLRTANNGRGGFNVKANGTTLTGELQFQSTSGHFHASRFTSLTISADGRQAWFAGIGRDGRSFSVYTEDNGEPGRQDIFQIWIDGVLQNGSGAMSGGNVQIHR